MTAVEQDGEFIVFVTLGGPDEATWYAGECGPVWQATPGAVAWLHMPFDGTTYRSGHDPVPPRRRWAAVLMAGLSAQSALLAVLSLMMPGGTLWHTLAGVSAAWCGRASWRYARH